MTTTSVPPLDPGSLTDAPTTEATGHEERAKLVRSAVRARSRELRAAHPILRHQDLIGTGVLAISTLVVVGSAVAYVSGRAPWWVVVPISAFAMSLAHEVEHDVIHRLYFARNKRAQDVMFTVGWLLRPYAVSPWVRRTLHLLHHEASGTHRDLEEQAITNGAPWSAKRMLMIVDPVIAAHDRLPTDPEARWIIAWRVVKAYFPLGWIAVAIWYSFLALSACSVLVGGGLAAGSIAAQIYGLVTVLVVVWIGPNVLRVACLHFISSNMHYFGDVEEGNVIEQTQVLNPWWLIPAQLFCCNFGSTHSIHHFVPNDPFYLRQLTAKRAHAAMAEQGVRFNDLGTFRRANRFNPIDVDPSGSREPQEVLTARR